MTDAPAQRPLSLYFVAAEESGDALGAALIRALKAAHRGPLDLAGVGGRAMAAAGIASPFGIEDLSIVGSKRHPAAAAKHRAKNSPDRGRHHCQKAGRPRHH